MKSFEWLDESTHPILCLETDGLVIRLQPIEQNSYDLGNLQCNLEILLQHSTGSFRYQAGDVYLASSDLSRISSELRHLLSFEERTCRLHSLDNQFLLELSYSNRQIRISSTLKEQMVAPQGGGILQLDFIAEDNEFIHRWRQAIEEFRPKLEEWILEHPPAFDGKPPSPKLQSYPNNSSTGDPGQ